MILYSITWYAVGLPFSMFNDAMQALYTFPAPWNTTITFMMLVFAWHPYIMLLGILGWAIVNSVRREMVTYEQ